MTGREIFEIWAPACAKWTDWARPVPFATINDSHKPNWATNFTMPTIKYMNSVWENTAIILDLPEYDSIKEGLALTKFGFRPIPLYNGTDEQQGAMALVDNHNIKSALIWGASVLAKSEISLTAPPVFLIDSNRTHRFKMNASVFDNSWDIYHQDLPSAEYFLNNCIHKIIVRSEMIQKDLRKILYGFQKKGITILLTNGYIDPKPTRLQLNKRIESQL